MTKAYEMISRKMCGHVHMCQKLELFWKQLGEKKSDKEKKFGPRDDRWRRL